MSQCSAFLQGTTVQCRQDVSAIVSRLDLCLRGKFYGIRTRKEQKKMVGKIRNDVFTV